MSEEVLHPGIHIRKKIIPTGMPVTEAAKLIGVGRPALSNLLNGNAALSPEMAARISKVFKFPQEKLLDMQAKYDASIALKAPPQSNVVAYVAPFLSIKAKHLEEWSDHNISSRSRLSVFLRTLVHSTTNGLTKVDFPGNDDSELPGWDGVIETNEGSAWVPTGRSGWEFGTNKDPKAKADKDYKKSTKATPAEERKQTTFVFVTPRRWLGKKVWVPAQARKQEWKDVVALDAVDIEQWLAQSLPGQAWFANETKIEAENVRSLDRCWQDWASVTEPSLVGSLFDPAIGDAKRTLQSRLEKPSEGPIIVAADSTEEALAFIAQALSERGSPELSSYRDKVLVFDKTGTLPRLAQGARPFIAVVHTRDVERELAPFAKTLPSIVIYPRNAAVSTPDITLEPINWQTFDKSLEEMGKDRDDISRLTKASGRSLTVLRRQLATVGAIKVPNWASDHDISSRLVPFLLVGAWHNENETDRMGLSLLSGDRAYSDLEHDCQSLTQINDAPLWSVGTYRGVVSKIDLLYSIAKAITKDDLQRYYALAGLVLGEDDPSLDLPEDQRWAASIYGKRREFSGAFRRGISETLVVLAVHGNQLFKKNLNIDTEYEAAKVVRGLLREPLTTRTFAANDSDLPTYAEAAPDQFLTILEEDLKTDDPVVLGLLVPASSGVFGGGPSRTGLLWALEGLSWNSDTLQRTAFILARLAQVEINDNWVNKPIHSLESIFRSWMPQTGVGVQGRIDLMKKLQIRFPEVAWKICTSQFGVRHQVGDYSHKPRWRPDGFGFGEPYNERRPVIEFVRAMVEMALAWQNYTEKMLGDLLEKVQDLLPQHQARVWELVASWAASASDQEKAEMREKVRTTTLSRRAALRGRNKQGIKAVVKAAKTAFDALEPADLLNRHAWLFKESWVEESADEIHDIEDFDYQARDERIRKVRATALAEVRKLLGLKGLLELSQRGRGAWAIGILCGTGTLSREDLFALSQAALKQILADEGNVEALRTLIGAIIRTQPDGQQAELLEFLSEGLSELDIVRLLRLSPYRRPIWQRVDTLGDTARDRYWEEVSPDWIPDSDAESNESVERLLKAKRPRAAFSCIRHQPTKIGAEVLFRLLQAMATDSADKPGQFQVESHDLEDAFEHVDTSTVLTMEQKAGLEFAFLEGLARPGDDRNRYGIPNLEKYVEAHPEVFVQAIAWTYKRTDEADDPPEIRVPAENGKNAAQRGYRLLEALKSIPAHNDLGELETPRLATWVAEVRKRCAALSRRDIGDHCIGKLLSHSPPGADGNWPCEAVRDVLEEIQSKEMIDGVSIGVYNSRGVHWRGPDGSQEREIAERYRKWGRALQSSHPYVASKLLLGISRTYEHDAEREDTEAGIRKRLS